MLCTAAWHTPSPSPCAQREASCVRFTLSHTAAGSLGTNAAACCHMDSQKKLYRLEAFTPAGPRPCITGCGGLAHVGSPHRAGLVGGGLPRPQFPRQLLPGGEEREGRKQEKKYNRSVARYMTRVNKHEPMGCLQLPVLALASGAGLPDRPRCGAAAAPGQLQLAPWQWAGHELPQQLGQCYCLAG